MIKELIKKIIYKLNSVNRDIEEFYFNKIIEQLKMHAEVLQRIKGDQDAFMRVFNEENLYTQDCLRQIEHKIEGWQNDEFNQIKEKQNSLDNSLQQLSWLVQKANTELHIHIDYFEQDVLSFFSQYANGSNPLCTAKTIVETEYPIAIKSNDHLYPRGTAHDNTRAPFFIRKCEELFPVGRSLKFMDIGCAGGGIVLDAVLRGHFAIGLEGSDYSLKHQRAEWRALRNNLFTCDVTHPFRVKDEEGKQVQFDVISAWEVLEHIPEEALDVMFKNIYDHLKKGGIFIGTAAQFGDFDPVSGAPMHVTIKPQRWWEERLESYGFVNCHDLFENTDCARAWGNPPLPWIVDWKPEESPYVAMRKQ